MNFDFFPKLIETYQDFYIAGGGGSRGGGGGGVGRLRVGEITRLRWGGGD